ncbi:hypothetical protein JNK13_01345 [bacterium]|nr:hypothetical protein [bacterium]
MGHPRRRYEHGGVYFITNRLAEGLPFVPNEYINRLILGVLSLAQEKCSDIAICALIFLQNHYHMVLVPQGDPARVKDFMNIFNGELAKMVCKLLGKRHVKIWAQRYHAAQILNAEACIKQLAYLYANPCSARVVNSIESWPGVSSWKALSEGKDIEIIDSYKYIRSRYISKLPNKPFSQLEIEQLCKMLDDLPGRSRSIVFKPFAWKSAFIETKLLSNQTLKETLVTGLHTLEKERIKAGSPKFKLSDSKLLSLQNPYKFYKPKEFGLRVICISTCLELRKSFIQLYKDFCEKCSVAWEQWRLGNYSFTYPSGAYLPTSFPRSSIYNIDY